MPRTGTGHSTLVLNTPIQPARHLPFMHSDLCPTLNTSKKKLACCASDDPSPLSLLPRWPFVSCALTKPACTRNSRSHATHKTGKTRSLPIGMPSVGMQTPINPPTHDAQL